MQPPKSRSGRLFRAMLALSVFRAASDELHNMDASQLSTTAAGRYPVNYGASTGNSFRLAGRGEVWLDAEALHLAGRSSWHLSFMKMREHTLPLADIHNVWRSGKHLRMSVTPAGQTVSFNTMDDASATALAERLPKSQTEEFSRSIIEIEDFQTRLVSLGGPALITPIILALNVLVFVCAAAAGAGVMDANADVMVKLGSNFGPLTMGGQWWRLLTATFLHFGLLHLALNMWALWGAGQLVEKLYGRASFLTLYLFSGLSGSIASLLWNPGVNSAGASGAIFGVFGGLLAFMARGNMRVPRSVLSAHRNSALAFVAYNLIYGAAHSGIDNAAHIGGLVGGFLIGVLIAQPFDSEVRRQASGQRLVLRTLGAVAVLALVSIPVTHPSASRRQEQLFRLNLYWFGTHEESELGKARQLLQGKVEAGTRQKVADELDHEVVPFWQDAVNRFGQGSSLMKSDLARQQAFFRAYAAARLDAFNAYSKGIRYDDAAAMAAGDAANDRVASLLKNGAGDAQSGR